ncbi:hypothetical protein SLS62_001767 [Diatrype stigma]|uniref:UDP-glucose/GDP-mannose dehydrogenase C-terminal domain-containing protein n=1 Tax=Diatrype stigma TaxID=117547 RepID=A0AAN9V183_9PEZI
MTMFPPTLDALSMEHLANVANADKGFSPIVYSITPTNPEFKQTLTYQDLDDTLGSVDPNDTPVVAVIGCGYVGTHLIQAFSRHYDVLGFDISESRLQLLREQFLAEGTKATLTTQPEDLTRATHMLVSVPTLVSKDKSIDTSYMRDALDKVAKYARRGTTVVIESSVAVGMTRELLGPLAQRRGFFAGMSPERVDPGRVEPPVEKIPKILSGLDDVVPGSLDVIQELYSRVFDVLVPVTRPEVAEMMKLYENCQRMMNIAFANEMADACIPHGIDPYEVCKAASSKPFGYMPFEPGVGLGGHCIPVNPWYLLSNSSFPLLKAATEKMEQRPVSIAEKAIDSLFNTNHTDQSPTKQSSTWEKVGGAGGALMDDKFVRIPSLLHSLTDENVRRLSDTPTVSVLPPRAPSLGDSDTSDVSGPTIAMQPRILVVGVGFKPGQSNLTNSPGLKVAQTLHNSGKVEVMFVDPFVEQSAIPTIPRLDLEQWNKAELETFDMIIVAFKQKELDLSVLDTLQNVKVAKWYQER